MLNHFEPVTKSISAAGLFEVAFSLVLRCDNLVRKGGKAMGLDASLLTCRT